MIGNVNSKNQTSRTNGKTTNAWTLCPSARATMFTDLALAVALATNAWASPETNSEVNIYTLNTILRPGMVWLTESESESDKRERERERKREREKKRERET